MFVTGRGVAVGVIVGVGVFVGVRVIVCVDVWVGVILGVGGIAVDVLVAVVVNVTVATGSFKLQADRIRITLNRVNGLTFITLLPFITCLQVIM